MEQSVEKKIVKHRRTLFLQEHVWAKLTKYCEIKKCWPAEVVNRLLDEYIPNFPDPMDQ